MKHPLIAAKIAREPWAVTGEVFSAIVDAVAGDASTVMPAKPDDDDDDRLDYIESRGTMVIPVSGILGKHLSLMEMQCGGCSVDRVSALLSLADRDMDVQRIILAINSPGGTVTGIPELADKIADISARKPVIAFTDSLCASAALWIASSATAFYSTQSARIGSVGVFIALLDASRGMEMAGQKVNAISAGKYKLAGAPFKPLSDDERAMFQARVDKLNAQFRAAVTEWRAVAVENLEGQTFDGEEALAYGFTDGIVDDIDELLDMPLDITATVRTRVQPMLLQKAAEEAAKKEKKVTVHRDETGAVTGMTVTEG